MTATYKAVGWNRQKKIYDRTLLLGLVAYFATFAGVSLALRPQITLETLIIRALGTAAFLLLHFILMIGPLARLDSRFLPWLYNRRHLGVTMFLLGLGHSAFSLIQFHALGDVNPLVSVLVSNTRIDSLAQFPFQPLGLLALLILFLMAATSHDFWLHQLSAPVWKRLHMAVYLAYGLLVAHVALGILQQEIHPLLTLVLSLGVASVVGLHLLAGAKERAVDQRVARAKADGFVEVCAVSELTEGRGKTVALASERVAVFRYDNKISALSNACQHQNGPLGEGRVINGCVVCPWHGYEYVPETGCSPPPFTEKVPTFEVRVVDDKVLVNPEPNPPGTPVKPAVLTAAASSAIAEPS